MKPMNANELLAGLALARPVPITAVVTDSRKVQPGCIFVCFPGERVDGHDYAAKAYQAGAEYVIANHPVEGVPEDHLVICESSYLAMIRMASNYRTLFSPLMIGVTGSVGKTTTKEFCYAVLSAFGNTLKTEGNQNNEIGLPNTLFRLEDTTQYAVVEMGMSHLGEIARLVRAARPSAGIITMIGVSHLENLGTRENILKAKMEICQGLPDGAPLVLNADDDLLPTAQIPGRLRPVWFGIRSSSADVRAINIHTVGEGTGFTLVDNVDGETYEFSVTIPTAGVHTVYDALAAYTAATRLGLERARAALLALFLAFGSGFIGFLDDYIKVVKHRNLGLLAWQKLIMQFIVTGGFLVGLHMQGLLTTIIMLPFIGAVDLGWVYYPIAFFGIIFLVNAVNLTDGLDGLCSCVTFVSMLGYLLAASMLSFYHVAVLAAATAAAAAGFLVWNFYPAKVFMGDTGSMFLGGMVTALAFIMGRPELVFFFGIVYIWDAMTVVIQRVYFKLTHGKRIFRMTPIHHAFEMRGWKEVKIDFFFSLIAIIGVVLGLMYVYMA